MGVLTFLLVVLVFWLWPRLTILALIVWLLFGCTTVPESIEACTERYTYTEEIEACETRVVEREDRRFKKQQRELQIQRESRLCYLKGGVFDHNSERCKAWSML